MCVENCDLYDHEMQWNARLLVYSKIRISQRKIKSKKKKIDDLRIMLKE